MNRTMRRAAPVRVGTAHPSTPRRASRGARPPGRAAGSLAAIALCAALALPSNADAQAVVMAGSYQNFDVLNNTGQPVHGFEMEVWGVSKSQLTRIFRRTSMPA